MRVEPSLFDVASRLTTHDKRIEDRGQRSDERRIGTKGTRCFWSGWDGLVWSGLVWPYLQQLQFVGSENAHTYTHTYTYTRAPES